MNKVLNQLLADSVVLYHKIQNAHWFVRGHQFYYVHSKMEEFYNALLPQIDELAEIVLMQGGKPVSGLKEFRDLSKIKEYESEFHRDIKLLFADIKKDFEYMLKSASDAKRKADEENNYLVSAKLDSLIEYYAKQIWMINQSEF